LPAKFHCSVFVLGHQSIGQSFGGKIIRAGKVMHGKLSPIYHNGQGVFADLPNPFTATRYHSLVIDQSALPEELEITAWTKSEEGGLERSWVSGTKHWPVEGVQFHPESIASEHGHQLLKNFLTA
jgi:anthranilate synthase component 2